MFGLFNKKDKNDSPNIHDKIWISSASKQNAFVNEWKKDPSVIFIFWFDESFRQAEILFAKETTEAFPLLMAREVRLDLIKDKRIILAEHYPLQEKENSFLKNNHINDVQVWSSMDEPFFTLFGGERIISLTEKLGMTKDETIEHPLIDQSIKNAQEKIAKKVIIEQLAMSQEDWFRKNYTH